METRKKFKQALFSLDSFSRLVTVNFDGKGEMFASWLSTITSLLIKAFMFAFFVYKYSIYANHEDSIVSLTYERTDFDKLGNVTLGSDKLVSFRFQDKFLRPMNMSYVRSFLQIEQHENSQTIDAYAGGKIQYKTDIKELETCSRE